jgi:16S rRNA (uracil1498-N3)-methyltransferase
MEIMPVEAIADLIARSDSEEALLFSERRSDTSSLLQGGPELTAIVGPEGGWDNVELEAAQKAGIRMVRLGGRILRAETAAIAIAAILQHRFGDLN